MTLYLLLGVAVAGWATAFGLYLQLKDALGLARSWRDIAIGAFADLTRERHLSEFAVRAMNPSEPLPSLDELRHLWSVDDA